MNEPVVEFIDIHKSYRGGFLQHRKKTVLKGLDLSVPRGGVMGFLGLNGSGKTTSIKILMGLAKADRGAVRLLGKRMPDLETLARVGYMPENASYYKFLNAEELLTFYSRLNGTGDRSQRKRIRHLVARVGLEMESRRRLKSYSKGMLQRIGFAAALLNDPEVLILDEPLSGLDPRGRKIVKDMIFELNEGGCTIFFSSHIMPDVEALCTEVVVLSDGVVNFRGRPEELTIRDILTYQIRLSADRGVDLTPLRPLVLDARRESATSVSLIVEGEDRKGEVLRYALEEGLEITHLTPHQQSLEDLVCGKICRVGRE